MANRTWNDLSPTAQKAVLAAGAAELALTTFAQIDLGRRPKHQVRGPKLLWRLLTMVQPVGPIAYLVLGRRR